MKIAGKLNCWSTYIVKDDTFFLLFMRKNLVGTLETSVVMHLQNLCLQPKKYGKLPPLQHSSKKWK